MRGYWLNKCFKLIGIKYLIMQNLPLDQPEITPINSWDKVKKVVGMNLLILFLFAAIVLAYSWNDTGHMAGIGYAIMMMYFVGFQVFVNLILGVIAFIQKKNASGKAFLLAMLAVAIIGASSCFGGMILL